MTQHYDTQACVKQFSLLLIIVAVVVVAIPMSWNFFFPDIVLPPDTVVGAAKISEPKSAPPTVRQPNTDTSNQFPLTSQTDRQSELFDLALVLDSAEFNEPVSAEEDLQIAVESDIDIEDIYLEEQINATEEHFNEMIELLLGETDDDQDITNTAEYQRILAEEEYAVNQSLMMGEEDSNTHVDPEEIQQFELEQLNAVNEQISDDQF